MLPECLMNACQKNTLWRTTSEKTAPVVVRRSDTSTSSKPTLKTSTYQQSRGNRLHRIEQSCKASYEGMFVSAKRKKINEA